MIIVHGYMAMYIEYHIYFHIIVNIFISKCVRRSVYNGLCWLHIKLFFVHKTINIIIVCLLHIASNVCDKVLFSLMFYYVVYIFKRINRKMYCNQY